MKRFIAVLLSIVLAFSISATTFAAYTDDSCDCGYVPVIYVTGFAQTPLAANAGTENEYNVFIPDNRLILNCVFQLIVPVIMLAFTGNYDSFADTLSSAVNNMMKDVACDDSGNPLNDTVDVVKRDAPSAKHGVYTQHEFRYDWREDVFDIADELNSYIEEIKELTGHDRVALKSESMGGAVVMTYLSVYGSDSVDSIVMQSSAYNGISMVGGIFTGDLEIKSQSALNYIGNFIEGNDVNTVFLRALYYTVCAAVFSPVSDILDKAVNKMKDKLYEQSISDLLGNIPGLWTFVPQEDYEQAKVYILDEDENAELIKKIDRYHYGVMDRTKEILDEAINNGVRLAIISNYGKSPVFVNSYDSYQSDFLIDTKRTSLGATCADIGETLGDSYVQEVADGHNHVSCDNIIDASTCMYPEYTWFIKDMMHTWYSTGYLIFTYQFIYSGIQQTVWTSSSYPQFLVNNHESRTLDPLTVENSNTQSTDVDYPGLIEQIINQNKAA